jgi:hypothetical protein
MGLMSVRPTELLLFHLGADSETAGQEIRSEFVTSVNRQSAVKRVPRGSFTCGAGASDE